MIEELEKEFERTATLLLGKGLSPINNYEKWLSRHVPLPYPTRSALSNKEVWLPPPKNFLGKRFNLSNVISMDEMEGVNKSPFGAEELCNASLKEIIAKFVKPIAYTCGNFRYQEYENIEESSGAGGGRNIFRCEDVYLKVKNVAYSNYALFCQNVFGCHDIMHSSFVINTYNSIKLARCFEVDGCSNSSDLLFCHNCENVRNSMFCFNTKNLRNAIGNVQLPLEKYKQIKSLIQAQIVDELEKKKGLKWDIYNIGCAGS